MVSGVYRIRNLVNGHCYIGSAVNVRARWAAHRHALTKHRKAPPKLQRAWDKYGAGAFSFEVVLECQKDALLVNEQAVIDAETPRYNTRNRAHSNIGVRWSADTNARKGRPKMYLVAGVYATLQEHCAHYGLVTKKAAQTRIDRGMPVDEAVTTPTVSSRECGVRAAATHKARGTSANAKPMTAFGVTAPIKVLVSRFSDIPYKTVVQRLLRGKPLEEALTTPRRGH